MPAPLYSWWRISAHGVTFLRHGLTLSVWSTFDALDASDSVDDSLSVAEAGAMLALQRIHDKTGRLADHLVIWMRV